MKPQGQEAIGWAVDVYWDEEEEWFSGEIVEYDSIQGYKIVYDDGDITWEPENAANIRYNNKIQSDIQSPRSPEVELEAQVTEIIPPDDDTSGGEEGIESESPESDAEIVPPDDETSEVGIESESPEPEMVSRSSLLDQFEQMNQKLAETISKSNAPGPGLGDLHCRVIEACGLINPIDSETCDPFVKVSFVEATGREKNIMLRCKRTIHTTETIENTTEPNWADSFLVQVDPYYDENGENWDKVQGDLLFAVYDANQGARNEFLGLVSFCLRDLIDGPANGIRAGEQQTRKDWYELKNRSGERIDGSIHLQLSLILPETQDLTIFEPIEPPVPLAVFMAPKSPVSVKSTSRSVKSVKSKSNSMGKTAKTMAMNAVLVKERIKKMKQKKLKEENELIKKRLAAVAPLKKKKTATEIEKKYKKQAQRRRDRVAAKEEADNNKQSKLVDAVVSLQTEIADLDKTNVTLKARVTRMETSNKRLLKSIKQSEDKRQTTSRSKSCARQYPYTMLSKKTKVSSESSKPAGSKLALDQISLLKTEQNGLRGQKERIRDDILAQKMNEQTYEAKIDEFQSVINKVQQRRVHGRIAFEEDEAYEQIRHLQIAIDVLRQSVETQEKLQQNREAGRRDRIFTLSQKCERKKAKIANCHAEIEKYRTMYEELVKADERTSLRNQIHQLQKQIYLNEMNPDLETQTQAEIDQLAAAFNEKMRQEMTETDKILDGSNNLVN